MNSLIDGLGLAGSDKEMFVEMIGLIHRQKMGQPIEDEG